MGETLESDFLDSRVLIRILFSLRGALCLGPPPSPNFLFGVHFIWYIPFILIQCLLLKCTSTFFTDSNKAAALRLG